jgi:uncharacterized protein
MAKPADPLPLKSEKDRVLLAVRVTPRARRTEICGLVEAPHAKRALGIRLAAPPVDGAANEALCGLLAREFGIARSAVSIRSGEASRFKLLEIVGDPSAIAPRLMECLS